MRKIILIVALTPMIMGCHGSSMYSSLDPDGIYEGWVTIDKPGLAFENSFYAQLKVWNDGSRAQLWDSKGRCYYADHAEYNVWTDDLEVYLRVTTTNWDSKCGYEIYHWEVRLRGDTDFRTRYTGEIEVDIDPEDYESENCYLAENPPPRLVGTFNLKYDYWNSHDY